MGADAAPFILLLAWVLPIIPPPGLDEALYLAVCGNPSIYTTCNIVVIFLSPYILDASYPAFQPHPPTLSTISPVVSSGDDAALPHRLRSSVCSRWGGSDSDNSSRSSSRDSEQKDPPEKEAVGGGTSDGLFDHPPSSVPLATCDYRLLRASLQLRTHPGGARIGHKPGQCILAGHIRV